MKPSRTRLGLGSVLVVLVLGLFVLDEWTSSRAAISAVIVFLGLAGYGELARMSLRSQGAPGAGSLHVLGLLSSAYFLGLAWWEADSGPVRADLQSLGLVWIAGGGFLLLVFRRDFLGGLGAFYSALLGTLLFGLLFSFLVRLYQGEHGPLRGLVLFAVVKGTDIVAYIAGTTLGRHRFLAVSPHKTVEGYVAAVSYGGVALCAASLLWPEVFFEWPLGLAFGIILAVSSALGDLAESLLKRSYQCKDSGSLLPEFGGVLDLIDSLVFSGCLFYVLLRL